MRMMCRQMSGFGGMVCIDLHGDYERAVRAFDRLRVIKRAASLGGVESIVSLPVLTSQWGHSDEQLAAAGVTKGMLRLSIGLEDVDSTFTFTRGHFETFTFDAAGLLLSVADTRTGAETMFHYISPTSKRPLHNVG